MGDNGVQALLLSELPSTEAKLRITLYQGLPKADKLEWIIQKTVELGVEGIYPVSMSRCIVKIDDSKKKSKTARWQAIAESAAKQSKRSAIPEVHDAISYKEAVELAGKMDQAIQQYATKMEGLVSGEEAKQNAATYTVVVLKKDQQLKMEVGCEVLLREGTAQCVSPSSPGLIDTTTGATINNGSALEVNHLYMSTITERGVKAAADNTKVLVRGGYTIV